MESGHCGLQFTDAASQQRFGAAFARHAGCNQTGNALLECLQGKPLNDVVFPTNMEPGHAPPPIDGMPAVGPFMPWYVTVDGTDEGLPDFPLTMLEAGHFDKNVPIVIGHNTNEFFAGLGVMILDAYGLTETCGAASISDPLKPLAGPLLTIPHAVLCSEMGAHFSPCGRMMAVCCACVPRVAEGAR